MLQTAQVNTGWEFLDRSGTGKGLCDLVLSETFWKVQDQNEARLIVRPDISAVRAYAR